MIKYLTIFFLLFSVACFGQEKRGTIKVKKIGKIKSDTASFGEIVEPGNVIREPLTIVEQMPDFHL